MGKWVKCTDKYPRKKGRYWVCQVQENRMPVAQMAWYNPEKARQRWFGFEPNSVILGVTHWMELPKPPKYEKEGGV